MTQFHPGTFAGYTERNYIGVVFSRRECVNETLKRFPNATGMELILNKDCYAYTNCENDCIIVPSSESISAFFNGKA